MTAQNYCAMTRFTTLHNGIMAKQHNLCTTQPASSASNTWMIQNFLLLGLGYVYDV